MYAHLGNKRLKMHMQSTHHTDMFKVRGIPVKYTGI